MSADRYRKAEEADKGLAKQEENLREKIANLDKTNATAIATLTAGIEHIVDGLSGIRSDMKEHREAVFRRLDRNESEIRQVKATATQSTLQLQNIQAKLDEGCGRKM